MGEEFTAGAGLKTGAFQRVFAEELAEGRTDIESSIAQFELGQKQDVAERRLGLEQGIAGMEAGDARRMAEMGADIEYAGTEMGRQDYTQHLDFLHQKQMLSQQSDISLYLNRMGFMQTSALQAQQYAGQLGLLGKQQSFQSDQAALDRALNERMYNADVERARQATAEAKKSQRTGAYAALGGTLLGGGLGYGAGALFGGATFNPWSSAFVGAGLFGGQQGLTSGGFDMWNKR